LFMMGWSRAQAEQDVVTDKYISAVSARDGQENQCSEEPSMVRQYVLEELAGFVIWVAHLEIMELETDSRMCPAWSGETRFWSRRDGSRKIADDSSGCAEMTV
jgi:hypothetical protein